MGSWLEQNVSARSSRAIQYTLTYTCHLFKKYNLEFHSSKFKNFGENPDYSTENLEKISF